jgi:hypothetical protein
MPLLAISSGLSGFLSESQAYLVAYINDGRRVQSNSRAVNIGNGLVKGVLTGKIFGVLQATTRI